MQNHAIVETIINNRILVTMEIGKRDTVSLKKRNKVFKKVTFLKSISIMDSIYPEIFNFL